MRSTAKFPCLTHSQSAEQAVRFPYRAPQCRVFTFRADDPLCESGDFIDDYEGGGLNTDNTDEETGTNTYNGGN